jgi:hypothetical protein
MFFERVEDSRVTEMIGPGLIDAKIPGGIEGKK